MNKLKCIAFSLAAGVAVATNAKTVYIDCNMSDYTGHDGSTPELALQSLGAAVYYGGAGADGDTIVVAEGVYNDTTYNPTGWWGPTRLHLDGKKFNFKASGRPGKTIIEGAFASGSEYGYGEGAVRCVTVQGTRAAASIFEGFTLRGGSTAAEGNAITTGGGATCSSDSGNERLAGPYFVGCIIENCSSPRGIAFGGTFVRCTIRENRFEHGKYFCDCSAFVNSIITRNWVSATVDSDYGSTMFNLATAINCTIAGNACNIYPTEPSYAYNNLVSVSEFPQGGATKYGEFVDSASTRVLMGPAFGDCRLRDGCAGTVKTADAMYLGSSYLSLPEEVDAYVDFYGNAISKFGPICAGCSQGVGNGVATAWCGPIVLSSPKMAFDGTNPGMANSYVYPSAYPTNLRVRTYNLTAGTRVFSYMYSALSNGHTYPVWGENDPTDVIPCASVGEVMTVGVRTTSNVFWTDPTLADYSTADDTFDHPFKTIQAAMNAGENTHAMFIVCAKKGTYGDEQESVEHADGGTTGKFRFVMPGGLPLRLVAVDGPENTFLVGKCATTDTGCGADAVSGFAVKGMGEIQGFTIRECYASTTGDGGFGTTGRCATHYSYAHDCNFDDCVITNNCGSYAVTGCGVFNRCRIVNNRAAVRTFGEYGALYSCVVSGNIIGDWNYQIHTSGNKIFNCSLDGDAATYMFSGDNSASHLRINCVVDDGGRELFSYGGNWGCVYWGFAQYAGENYLKANPMFVDKPTGDLRMAKVSEGVSRGVRPDDDNANDWWLYAMTDVNRNPVTFDAHGCPNPGAYADDADGVYVDIPNGGAMVSGGKIGFNVLEENNELKIAVASGNRPCAGVLINGVTNDFQSAQDHVITIDSSVGNALISAFYTTDWYVAPDGTNSASGFYPDDAKSLQKGLEAAQAGDTVWAASGTYDQGTMMQDGGTYVRSRAVVPASVTLASLSGRNKTVIKGAAASVEDVLPEGEEETGKGLGADAIRCVFLGNGSRVKGFTLKDGHTRAVVGESGTERHSGWETCGAGVGAYGANRRHCWVEDCIIENCNAYRGAGNIAVKSKNCVYRNNYAVYIGAGSSDTECYGDLTYGNEVHWGGNDNRGPACSLLMESCTVMDGFSKDNDNTVLRNCLVNGSFNAGTLSIDGVRLCVFNTGTLIAPDEWRAAVLTNGCVIAEDGQLVFDDDNRPVIGSNCAIDAGDESLNAEEYSTDVLEGQRVYNGKIDVGAVEADWRPVYSRDIRKDKYVVTEASPLVIENDSDIVTMNGLSELAATWSDSSGRASRKTISVRVTGNGVLYLKLNGELVKEVTAETADPTYQFSNALAENRLEFEYVPGEEDPGCAQILKAFSTKVFIVSIR